MPIYVKSKTLISIAAFTCLMMGPGFHQPVVAQVTSASISGVIVDASGAVIANADVTVRNTGTNSSRVIKANSVGVYAIPDLPVGNYELTVRMNGFKTSTRTGIALTVGAANVQNYSRGGKHCRIGFGAG